LLFGFIPMCLWDPRVWGYALPEDDEYQLRHSRVLFALIGWRQRIVALGRRLQSNRRPGPHVADGLNLFLCEIPGSPPLHSLPEDERWNKPEDDGVAPIRRPRA
jgi:hypothetical protein